MNMILKLEPTIYLLVLCCPLKICLFWGQIVNIYYFSKTTILSSNLATAGKYK